MAVFGGVQFFSLDIVGLFILLAGFVISLGAVTVIDIHGFWGANHHTGMRRPHGPTG